MAYLIKRRDRPRRHRRRQPARAVDQSRSNRAEEKRKKIGLVEVESRSNTKQQLGGLVGQPSRDSPIRRLAGY